MKRLFKYTALILCICLLAGCARKSTAPQNSVQEDQLSVCASIYPFFALSELITENVNNVQLNCLVQPQDGCLRNYQLSDWDLAILGGSDAIIAGGNGLESFESLLYMLGEEGPAVVFTLHGLDLLQLPAANTQQDSDSHWLDKNPHIYMSIEGAQEILKRISSAMILLDSEHEEQYTENLKLALLSLDELNQEVHTLLAHVQGKPVVIMNEALVYAAQSYGLEIELCYDRESGETLEGTELDKCLALLHQCDSRIILLEKQAPQSLIAALQNRGYTPVLMDILSTRRADEGAEGYFDAHRANARILSEAFTEANTSADEILNQEKQ